MNFAKQFKQYDRSALIQKEVASNLINFFLNSELAMKNYNKIFEVGCGTGVFTKLLTQKFPKSHFILNDKFSQCLPLVSKVVPEDTKVQYLFSDIQDTIVPEVDLIASSSVFQWISDKDSLFEKLSSKKIPLIFSIYTKGNLKEIKNHFSVSLDYESSEYLNDLLKLYYEKVEMSFQEIKLNFDTPLEALRHLKETGVTGFAKAPISLIRSFDKKELTYSVTYFLCS